jgi:hypothetical protein
MPEGRNALGRASLVPFARRARKENYSSFARAKKVTRSPAGRVEAFALEPNKQRAKSLDSRFRGNDEQEKQGKSWMTSPSAVESPAFAG